MKTTRGAPMMDGGRAWRGVGGLASGGSACRRTAVWGGGARGAGGEAGRGRAAEGGVPPARRGAKRTAWRGGGGGEDGGMVASRGRRAELPSPHAVEACSPRSTVVDSRATVDHRQQGIR